MTLHTPNDKAPKVGKNDEESDIDDFSEKYTPEVLRKTDIAPPIHSNKKRNKKF